MKIKELTAKDIKNIMMDKALIIVLVFMIIGIIIIEPSFLQTKINDFFYLFLCNLFNSKEKMTRKHPIIRKVKLARFCHHIGKALPKAWQNFANMVAKRWQSNLLACCVLARALETARQLSARRKGEDNYAYAIENMNSGKIGKEYAELYRNLANLSL